MRYPLAHTYIRHITRNPISFENGFSALRAICERCREKKNGLKTIFDKKQNKNVIAGAAHRNVVVFALYREREKMFDIMINDRQSI